MRKWEKYLMTALLCVGLAGCGRKETGSDLLTDAQEAVAPVEEAIEPAAERTDEGIALHIYCGDEQAEHIVQRTVYVDEVTEHVVTEQLILALGLDQNAGLKSIFFGMHGGDRVVILDLNQAFADAVKKLNSANEYIAIGSLVNTFLDCYRCELLLLTAEGKVLETENNKYEEYLETYPYVESSYRVKELLLGEGNMKISCPQIEGLKDDQIQGKWNRIMLGTEERVMDEWDGSGSYEVSYTVKTMTDDVLSILMTGSASASGDSQPYVFKYTYNIDLNTGKSIRLRDHVDVEKVAQNMFAGTGYYIEESLAKQITERLAVIYDSPDALARSLDGYDYSEDGSAPYGYSYLSEGKVWICMEVPHTLGDYVEIELDAQEK